MPNSIMYQEDCYVVLSPDLNEQFVSLAELKELLTNLLRQISPHLPQDLQNIDNPEQQVQRLIDTVCELDCDSLGIWQWYVVRLEKP
jgi:hypothetical protein